MHSVGRVLVCLVAGLASAAGTASGVQAQQLDVKSQRELLRMPPERSFLDPGSVPFDRRAPGYVVDQVISSPAYGTTDRFGETALPRNVGK